MFAPVTKPTPDGATITHHPPLFELRANIQGIVSDEHAAKIARTFLSAIAGEGSTVVVSAQESES